MGTSTTGTATTSTSTTLTSTATTSTITTLSGCSGNLCRVCKALAFSDTNKMANHIDGTLRFGPSQFNNEIDEAKVAAYEVVFADSCGTQVGTWSKTVDKTAADKECCDTIAYSYTFTDVEIPEGATSLAVLVKGSDGSSGGMYTIPINDDDEVRDIRGTTGSAAASSAFANGLG